MTDVFFVLLLTVLNQKEGLGTMHWPCTQPAVAMYSFDKPGVPDLINSQRDHALTLLIV